jgi:acylphosphatase
MSIHILISGFVQGVGYRQFVKKTAKNLGLTGWVRNIPDRKVEVLATGTKDKLEQLASICKKGTVFSNVSGISVDWLEQEEIFNSFDVVL